MEGQAEAVAGGGDVFEGGKRAVDFKGTGHEDEAVTLGVGFEEAARVPGGLLPGGAVGHGAGIGGVFERDGKHSALAGEGLTRLEPGGEAGGVERGGHDDDEQVGPDGFLGAAGEGEGKIAGEVAFVKLVEDDGGDAGQGRVGEKLPEEDALSDKADAGAGGDDAVEADVEAHFAAEGRAAFLGDALGEEAGGEPARLEDDNFATGNEALVEKHLRDLGGLAGAGGRLDDEPAHARTGRDEAGAELLDGEAGGVHAG